MTGSIFQPETNKIYLFSDYSMLLLKSGSGLFQVDFRNYRFSDNKAIFLSPGQYFQLLHGNLEMFHFRFSADAIIKTSDFRYLFKHVISLGHIDLAKQKQVPSNMPFGEFSQNTDDLLNFSVHRWLIQNPFKSTRQEIGLIFDLKELIDDKFRERIDTARLLGHLYEKTNTINTVVKRRLGITVNQLVHHKLLLEAQREIAFTDKTMKEITYDLGFKDPAYFHRFFKSRTNQSPLEFRELFDYEGRDGFLNDLLALIDLHYKSQRSTAFYADQLNMSIKTLSKKVKLKLNMTTGQLVRDRLIAESKKMLLAGLTIQDIAFDLGFEESNHFSAFFKAYSGETPTQFRNSTAKSAIIVE